MIVMPEKMDFSEKRFYTILYGPPGIGKTTLALSAPKPLLVDLDNGISRVAPQHRTPTVVCQTYEEMRRDITPGNLAGFETVVIDTGGNLVTYLKDWAMRVKGAVDKRGEFNSLKGFGLVKQEVSSFLEYITKVLQKNLVIVFHSQEEKDKDGSITQRITCEGSFRNTVWTPCDFGGYCQVIGGERVISFTPTQEYFAKGTQGIKGQYVVPVLGENTKNDFLANLFAASREEIQRDAQMFEARREEYNAVMSAVREILDKVVDAASANAACDTIKHLAHVLTSKKESSSLLMSKAGELGIKWTKEGFVPKEAT